MSGLDTIAEAEPKAAPTPDSGEQAFRVPRRFQVHVRVNGNPIRQLAFVEHQRQLKFSPYSKGRTAGFIGTDAAGNRVFVCAKLTQAAIQCDEVLYVPDLVRPEVEGTSIPRGAARWLKPEQRSIEDIEVADIRCLEATKSWKDKFEFNEEEQVEGAVVSPGLRRPQIGALHAALAHWSVDHKSATIVMPTGTGKTETMLALLVSAQIRRLLVVVPTSALRDQISEKFLTLGILEKAGCLLPGGDLPVVASLHHAPKSVADVDAIFRRANVIVSTMQVVARCATEVQARMAELCSHLFIDEAHHIAARTWYDFKQKFAEKTVLQFTATPFRTDGKRVDGRFIYSYPLSKAQKEGYFKPIKFIAINEFDPDDADDAIARRALDCLQADLEAGHDHILMARVDTISRAAAVHGIYGRLAGELAPVVIHSETPQAERKELMRRLRARESRVVVCVDMFGEGFDFPELKIAALHDRHKSLAITLQFVGRFTRTQADIGDACVIANTSDEAVSSALRNLYAEDADWNFLLRMLSEGATDRARKRTETIEGFTDSLPEIPLQTLFPRMSAVVYKTACERWEPTRIEDVVRGTRLYAGPVINPEKNLAIFVTRDEEMVRWGSVKQIQNVQWNLYVLHWNEHLQLLFINSSKPKDFHEELAEAVGGSRERILGETVFRTLSHIKRLTLTNLGLSHAFGKNIRYTMFMGADIADGLSEAATFNKRKSNVFGLGYEDDEKVTAGCSFKGRLWSHKVAFDLSEWVDWCAHVGRKLLDESIRTDDIFANVVKARRVSQRPESVPVMVSWPEGFLEQPEDIIEIEAGGRGVALYECDIGVVDYSAAGPLIFSVVAGTERFVFEVVLSEQAAQVVQRHGPTAYATLRGNRKRLVDWFMEDPPIIHFANGDFLVFNELFEIPPHAAFTYPAEKIVAWDWEGVDIRRESQGDDKNPASIQRRVIDKVLAGHYGDFDVVFDDDGSGEVADVVAIKQDGQNLRFALFHCKYSKGEQPGARIEDLYEVCGQAQKSVRWREGPKKLLKHLLHREILRGQAGRPSRFEKGDRKLLQTLANRIGDFDLTFGVHLIQPGISKVQVASAHQSLLGATEAFLKETYSMDLEVICSP